MFDDFRMYTRVVTTVGIVGTAALALSACSTPYERALSAHSRTPPLFRSAAGEAAYSESYERLLGRWPERPTSVFVPTRFGPTHVLVSGPEHAPVVVLLHAVSLSSAAWFANAPAFSEQFRVYAVDGIGDCGLSRMTALPRDLPAYADWLADVFAGLGIESASLVGHSYGAFLAINFAIHRPASVERLVLMAPAASIQPIQPFLRLMLKHPRALPFFRPSAERTLRMQAHPGFEPEPALVRMMETVATECLVTTIFPRVYTVEELSAIRSPTMLLVGDHEKLYDPRKAIARAQLHIPHLEAVLLAAAGHTLNLERPDAVNTVILRFLQSSAGR